MGLEATTHSLLGAAWRGMPLSGHPCPVDVTDSVVGVTAWDNELALPLGARVAGFNASVLWKVTQGPPASRS